MKLYNYELEKIIDFLINEFDFAGKQNRMRMKFVKILLEKLQEFKEDHLQILKEYCHLDEKGNPKTYEKDGIQYYDVIDEEKYKKAYQELANEEVIVEENETNKNMLLTLKESVENCHIPFRGEKAILHERLCELFDGIYGGETIESKN